jgi:hypothetical protein
MVPMVLSGYFNRERSGDMLLFSSAWFAAANSFQSSTSCQSMILLFLFVQTGISRRLGSSYNIGDRSSLLVLPVGNAFPHFEAINLTNHFINGAEASSAMISRRSCTMKLKKFTT